MDTKLTKARLATLRRNFKRCKTKIRKCEMDVKRFGERLSKLKSEHDHIILLACDGNCENDGNAHRPACSVYKLL